jgi:uncharacterized protein (TIGR02145 family)
MNFAFFLQIVPELIFRVISFGKISKFAPVNFNPELGTLLICMKKSDISIAATCLIITLVAGLSSCKKKDDNTVSLPTASTTVATWVGQTWATMNGSITPNNFTAIVSFEYDTTTSYRNVVKASPDTVEGNESTIVSYSLTGLKSKTTYHYRVKAEYSGGTVYGGDLTFTTADTTGIVINFNTALVYGSVKDIDGNNYKTIQIGSQEWMAENLRTTRFRDGTGIQFLVKGSDWAALTGPGYCWYNNDSIVFGALYNYYAVNTGNLCPAGWHIPSDGEWSALTIYLGPESIAGNKLKEAGTGHWTGLNSVATNESGFTALPGGCRTYTGSFTNIGRYGYWWSSTEATASSAYSRDLYYGYSNIDRNSGSKLSGFSVRCVKDIIRAK